MKEIKNTVKLLRRSPYQAMAAIIAMSLTFFITSLFVDLLFGGQKVLNYVEQRPQVMAFFKDDVSQAKVNEIVSEITATGLAKDIKYVDKEAALAIYREKFKNEPLLLQSVSSDFLPASIDISIKKASDVGQISKLVKEKPEVEKVITPEDLVEQLLKWTKTIRFGGLALVSTLMVISFLIIIMVIGMRIALRREEIAIMNLVGATRWFIARPFFIEGAIYGALGASVATILNYVILLFYSPNIQNFLGPIQVFPLNPLFFIYLWMGEVLAASTVGVVGAAIALFRYLKIK